MVGPDQLVRILARMLDTDEFLSAVRAAHAVPRATWTSRSRCTLGGQDFTVGYEPAESTSGLFGGNSNWRGPIWMPVNFLLIERAARLRARSSATTCRWSTRPGPGEKRTLDEIADDLSDRLISLFTPDDGGPAARSTATTELLPDPPGLAGPDRLPGVLPRRQRRRPGRVAPDRLDGAGRRPDPHPAPLTPSRSPPGGDGVPGRMRPPESPIRRCPLTVGACRYDRRSVRACRRSCRPRPRPARPAAGCSPSASLTGGPERAWPAVVTAYLDFAYANPEVYDAMLALTPDLALGADGVPAAPRAVFAELRAALAPRCRGAIRTPSPSSAGACCTVS